MAFIRHLVSGLRRLMRRRAADRDLDDELRDYLDRSIAARAEAGLTPDEATRLARVETGSLAAARDEVRSGLWETVVETMGRDLGRAVRGLIRTPGFSITALLTVAVGTAAVTAMITLVRAAFFAPIPFPQGEQFMRVWRSEPGSAGRLDLSYPDVRFLRDSVRSFDAFESTALARKVFLAAAGGRRVEGEAVSAGYFALLGVHPIAGRLFRDEEYEPGRSVALLSAASAQSLFGSEEDAVGRQIATPDGGLTVVGVMPPGFTGTVESDSPEIEFWVPLDSYIAPDRREDPATGGIWAIGRRRPGVTLAQANAELREIGPRIAARYPATHAQNTYVGEAFGENWRVEFRRGAWMVFGAAVGLLLVAALNTSALLLSRALARRREEAVRLALGATRARLVTSAFFETSVVVVAGGAVGAWFAKPVLLAILGQTSLKIPTYLQLRPDAITMLCVVLTLAATALLAGLSPAWLAAGVPVRLALVQDGRSVAGSPGATRLWSAILVVQIAATAMLTAGSVALLRTWQSQLQIDLGFRTQGVLRMSVFLSPDEARTPASIRSLTQRIREVTTTTAGVHALGMLWPTVPLPRPTRAPVRWAGMPEEARTQGIRAGLFGADPDVFRVLDIRVVAGRAFQLGDDERGAMVAIVSRSLADVIGGAEAAVEHELAVGTEVVRIVGVVENVKFGGPFEDETHRYEVYRPLAQLPRSVISLFVDASGDTAGLVPELSRRITDVVPASAIDWVGPVDHWLREQVGETRFLGLLFALFGTASLLLTALGIVGLTLAGVARSRRELAIRQILGGSAAGLQAGFASKAIRLAIVGTAFGAAGSVLLGQLMQSTVGDLNMGDPSTIAIAGVVLIAGVGVAAWIPARRVTRIRPVEALRE